ncbi:MAG: hypothetical protein K2X03_13980 [Bryobacteraceae bacterium]|nr:hypothetical protein [Bryobacteraceae bacterium]
MPSELIQYPVPWDLVRGLTPHLASRTSTNIVNFTARIVERMQPGPVFEGLERLPENPRFILAANHYQRPGLWILHTAAVLTQALVRRYGTADPPVRWIVTANWPPIRLGPWRIPSPGDWLLPRVAEVLQCYPVSFAGQNPAFTAKSVRRILKDARSSAAAIGIFPEGVAGSAGQLTAPLPGVDRFLSHLGKTGLPLVPCGISESGRFVIRFGDTVPAEEVAASEDAAALAMARIALLI